MNAWQTQIAMLPVRREPIEPPRRVGAARNPRQAGHRGRPVLEREILDALRAESMLNSEEIAVRVCLTTNYARHFLVEMERAGKVRHIEGANQTRVKYWVAK